MPPTTDIETHKIAFSPRTLVSMLVSVIFVVSGYFFEAEKVSGRIDDTNKRMDAIIYLIQTQQSLIMANRYKDSIEIDYLSRTIKK